MTPEKFTELVLSLNPWVGHPLSKKINLRVNPLHERPGAPGSHRPASVGRMTYLARKYGRVDYSEFVSAYFADSHPLQHNDPKTAGNFGRSAAHVLEQANSLLEFIRTQPEGNDPELTDEGIISYFAHLVFCDSWLGAYAERRLLEYLQKECPSWKYTDSYADIKNGIDLMQTSGAGVQVKPQSWKFDSTYAADWLFKSSGWQGPRWVVRYAKQPDGTFVTDQVRRVEGGNLINSSLLELIVACGGKA